MDKVLFITNVDGLLMEDKLVPKLTLAEAKEIRPKIGPGMEKKILASTEALNMGVKNSIDCKPVKKKIQYLQQLHMTTAR